MNLDYVPLLRVMRDLHSIPRGQPPDFNGKKRFKQYLRTIFDYDKKVVKLPLLLAMNPMGKDHVTALLDAYQAPLQLFVRRRWGAPDVQVLEGCEWTGRASRGFSLAPTGIHTG